MDRKSITLEQEDLVKQVYAANPHTVVVLISSFPFAINWTQENIPAILHMAHNSDEEGNALADALFGDTNPGGRLVTTWPASLDQLPPMMDYDIRHGHTHMYFKGKPLYPFGYGLSYTKFDYANLKTSADHIPHDGQVAITLELKNSGARAGDEVVQLYITHVGSKVDRPQQELKAFRRVSLAPGKKSTVQFTIKASDLAYWSTEKGAWQIEPDQIKLEIGSSSADARLTKTLTVE